MRGQFYSSEIKEDIKKFIMEGKSYREITEIFGIPKSTISTWFGKTLKKPMNREVMLQHLREIRKLASKSIIKKWGKIRDKEDETITQKIQEELPSYPFDNMGFYKSMLAMLYWAEGSKGEKSSGLKFANTDPALSNLYITLLRKCYNINEKKLSIGIHLHYYHSILKTRKFWSKILNVPVSQFNKVYIKRRSKTKKFRKNFVGICFIYYGDSNIRKELLKLGLMMQEIIVKK